jgi:alkylated DNA repair dioxygenase AlkB
MPAAQLSLFETGPALPAGFSYAPDLITPAEEAALIAAFEPLPFAPFEFHGYLGKRRVISFGWRYDFSGRALNAVEPLPDFLLGLRDRTAAFAGRPPTDFPHAMITEYAPGAAIGWHRDRPEFGEVLGVSLASECVFRLRRRAADGGWERVSTTLAPRSAYVLRGEVRTAWQHSIPGVEALRYSVTFRSLA